MDQGDRSDVTGSLRTVRPSCANLRRDVQTRCHRGALSSGGSGVRLCDKVNPKDLKGEFRLLRQLRLAEFDAVVAKLCQKRTEERLDRFRETTDFEELLFEQIAHVEKREERLKAQYTYLQTELVAANERERKAMVGMSCPRRSSWRRFAGKIQLRTQREGGAAQSDARKRRGAACRVQDAVRDDVVRCVWRDAPS